MSAYNPLIAEEEEWHFAYETNGINIYRRVAEGSKFLEFKADGKPSRYNVRVCVCNSRH